MTKGININKFIAMIPAVVRFAIQSQKNLNSSPETQQNTTETPKSSKTKLGLAALAMSTIVSGTQAQASDLLAQCDYNQNGIIDGRTYLKAKKAELKKDGDYSDEDKKVYKIALTNAKKERKCKTEIDKNRIAEKKIYLAQLDMNIENLRNELKKVEEELRLLRNKKKIKKEELGGKKEELGGKKEELGGKKEELGGKKDELGGKKDELGGKKEELGGKEKELEKKIKVLKDLISKAAQQLLKYK